MRENAGDNYVSNREFGDLAKLLMKLHPRVV
jgi:hypothetical protein